MRSRYAIFAIIILLAVSAIAADAPETLLQRGQESYRAGRYADAVNDLKAASEAFLSPEAKQNYINTGRLETLPQFETSLIYLSLAYSKMGRENEARDAISRIAAAERIEPTFGRLQLGSEVAEFTDLAGRIAPAMPLPSNTALAQGGTTTTTAPSTTMATTTTTTPSTTMATTETTVATPAPTMTTAPTPTPAPVVVAEVTPAPTPTTTATTTETTATPTTATADAAKLAVQPTIAEERQAMLRTIEARVAEARAQIERDAQVKIAAAREEAERNAAARVAEAQATARDAEQKIAAAQAEAKRATEAQAAAQRATDERIAQERANAARDAEQKIAAAREEAQRAADARVAEERAAAQRAADQRVAEERANAQRAAEQRIAEERANAEAAARQRVAAAEAETRRALLTNLRQAESFANNGDVSSANSMYARVIEAPNVNREALAAAATGLYRTGDFRRAVQAFNKLGTFQRGEEDLRYYNAVSLYETGQYDQAKKELACALPFIQVTEDVARYRTKIEQTPSRQAAR